MGTTKDFGEVIRRKMAADPAFAHAIEHAFDDEKETPPVPTDPAELAALIEKLQRWKEAFDENFFVTDHPDDARQFADAMLSFLPTILAALTQARADREEVERLKEEVADWKVTSEEIEQKNEWLRKAEAERDRLRTENEALARKIGCLEPNEHGQPSCDPPCMACAAIDRTAAAKEGT